MLRMVGQIRIHQEYEISFAQFQTIHISTT